MALSEYELTRSAVMIEFSMTKPTGKALVSAFGNYYLFLLSRPFQTDKLFTSLKC